MPTAKPPAHYGAIWGSRAGGFALPSYTTSRDTTRHIDSGHLRLTLSPSDFVRRVLPSLLKFNSSTPKEGAGGAVLAKLSGGPLRGIGGPALIMQR